MARYSQQRENILLNLQGRKDHPTADMVYEGVKEIQPNISLGTVYRNLAFLSERGQIMKISAGVGPEHYDGNPNPHNHFICKSCGRILDMDFMPAEDIVEEASRMFDGDIQGYELKFYGTCDVCKSKE